MSFADVEEIAELSARNDQHARNLMTHLLNTLNNLKKDNQRLQMELSSSKMELGALNQELHEAASTVSRLSTEMASMSEDNKSLRTSIRTIRAEYGIDPVTGLPAGKKAGGTGGEKGVPTGGAAGGKQGGGAVAQGAGKSNNINNNIGTLAGEVLGDPLAAASKLLAAIRAAGLPAGELEAVLAGVPADVLQQLGANAEATAARDGATAECKGEHAAPLDANSATLALLLLVPSSEATITSLATIANASRVKMEISQRNEADAKAELWLMKQELEGARMEAKSAIEKLAAQTIAFKKLQEEVDSMRKMAEIIPKLRERERNVEMMLSAMLSIQPEEVVRMAPGVDVSVWAGAAADKNIGALVGDADRGSITMAVLEETKSAVPVTSAASLDKGMLDDERLIQAIKTRPWIQELTNTKRFVPVYIVSGSGAREPRFMPIAMLQHRIFVMLCRNCAASLARTSADATDMHPYYFVATALDGSVRAEMQQKLAGLWPHLHALGDAKITADKWDEAIGATIAEGMRGPLLYSFASTQKLHLDDLCIGLRIYLQPADALGQDSMTAICERLYVWIAASIWQLPLDKAEREIASTGKFITAKELRTVAVPAWAILSFFPEFETVEHVTIDFWISFFKHQAALLSDASFLHLLYALKELTGCTLDCLRAPASLTDEENTPVEADAPANCIIM